jgi:hypothetical protein
MCRSSHFRLRLRRDVRGVSASRVRDMFEQAKKNAPCIIAPRRNRRGQSPPQGKLGGGNDERDRRSTSCWSRWMASRRTEHHPIAATNRPDVLIRRAASGRFDRQVVVPNGRSAAGNPEGARAGAVGWTSICEPSRGTRLSSADLANLISRRPVAAGATSAW